MILVKTRIGKSMIHGIGLFADQFIPKGTKTWEYNSKFDSSFFEEDLKYMSDSAREQFLNYAFLDKKQKKYILCFDDQRFINHSELKLNIQSYPYYDISIRDIERGEELLCNYNDYEEGFFRRKGIDEKFLV